MSISYKDSGVNIDEGAALVEEISSFVQATHSEEVLTSLGSFAGLYDIGKYRNPVLVSGTDGVGTKMILALKHNELQGIGQDCVAMCVNDILCHGAKPLFFLDYLACGELDKIKAATLVRSIAKACKDCSCALIGGETAEMPGMYKKGDYDIAGFAVGVVDKENIIDASQIRAGNKIIACASSGLHSNGFSLVRSLFPDASIEFRNEALYHSLLIPTRIYVNSILDSLEQFNGKQRTRGILGIAHITGGGIIENLPRIIPNGLWANVKREQIKTQAIFELIRETRQVKEIELWKTFNMGIGLTLIVDAEQEKDIIEFLNQKGEQAFSIGEIADSPVQEPCIMENKICLI